MATMKNKYRGIVYLSEEQFDILKSTGTLEFEGQTYTYSPFDTTYVTPSKFDTEMSNTSENAVQNKTIKKYVDDEIAQIETEISTIPKFAVKVVSSLPTTDISTTTIYLVPSEKYETENYYDEYIYVDGKWELIGTTKIDLTNYARTDEENTFVATNTFNGETIFNGVAEHNADVKVNNSVFKVLDNTVEENGTQRDFVTSYSADDIVRETGDGETKQTYTYTYPEKSGTLALTTDVPDVNVDNSTISKNDQNQLQAIGLTDGTNINTFEEIDEAMTIERL